MRIPTPIPYAEMETGVRLAPVRVLMAAGSWEVPERERPADWRNREKPILAAPPEPPSQRVVIVRPPLQCRPPAVKQVPKKQNMGRPRGTGRIQITAQQILALRASKTMDDIATALECHVSHLYRILTDSGVSAGSQLCLGCGAPTGKKANARRCKACADKRENDLRRDGRTVKREPEGDPVERRRKSQREWARKSRADKAATSLAAIKAEVKQDLDALQRVENLLASGPPRKWVRVALSPQQVADRVAAVGAIATGVELGIAETRVYRILKEGGLSISHTCKGGCGLVSERVTCKECQKKRRNKLHKAAAGRRLKEDREGELAVRRKHKQTYRDNKRKKLAGIGASA